MAGETKSEIFRCEEKEMSYEYLPFRGLSAWFSSSVKPSLAKKWDEFGGCLASEDQADFLFSDSSYSVDTVRVYDSQLGVTVFQSAWLCEVVRKRCTVHDIPLGQYLVLPHYLIQMYVSGDPPKTPEPATLMVEHRENCGGGGDGGGGGSLSKLLAKREEMKLSTRLSHDKESKKKASMLKNSREFYSSSWPGSQSEINHNPSTGKRDTTSNSVIMSEGVGVGMENNIMAVWDHLRESMKSTTHNDFQHLNTMELLDYMLIDFNPALSKFTMRRK